MKLQCDNYIRKRSLANVLSSERGLVMPVWFSICQSAKGFSADPSITITSSIARVAFWWLGVCRWKDVGLTRLGSFCPVLEGPSLCLRTFQILYLSGSDSLEYAGGQSDGNSQGCKDTGLFINHLLMP